MSGTKQKQMQQGQEQKQKQKQDKEKQQRQVQGSTQPDFKQDDINRYKGTDKLLQEVVDITGYTHEGAGVGRIAGRVVFVPGALSGERVLVEVSGADVDPEATISADGGANPDADAEEAEAAEKTEARRRKKSFIKGESGNRGNFGSFDLFGSIQRQKRRYCPGNFPGISRSCRCVSE